MRAVANAACEATVAFAISAEREKIARAIEAGHDIWDATDYDRGRMDGLDQAARIAREA